jgi:hypothetical protein
MIDDQPQMGGRTTAGDLILLPTATCSGEVQLTLTNKGVTRFGKITIRQSIANRGARKELNARLAMFHVIQSVSEPCGGVIVHTVKDSPPRATALPYLDY